MLIVASGTTTRGVLHDEVLYLMRREDAPTGLGAHLLRRAMQGGPSAAAQIWLW